MKILLVSLNHTPELTGIGKYHGEMAAWLAEHGHQVRVVTAPPYYPEWRVQEGYSAGWYARENVDGARVTRVPLYVPRSPGGLKRILHLLSFSVSALPVLLWLGLFWRPTVIVLTAPPLMAAPGVLAAKLLSGAGAFLHIQDFEVDAAFRLGILKQQWLYRAALCVERLILRFFNGVSTISPRMRDVLVDKGVPAEKASLVPNWANVHDFDVPPLENSLAKELKQDADTILAVYSGNLGRKQGLETIVDSAKLLSDLPMIHFVISGEGAGKEDMMERAGGLPNVTFLPVLPADDFINLMFAADIHLLPQRKEAADLVMPSKLGNILASGRPVVVGASEGTQLFEAVQGCGVAVTPGDSARFAEAISSLASDSELRDAMGRRARERALKEWTKERSLERFDAMIGVGAPPLV